MPRMNGVRANRLHLLATAEAIEAVQAFGAGDHAAGTLDDVSLAINAGEFFALSGHSGRVARGAASAGGQGMGAGEGTALRRQPSAVASFNHAETDQQAQTVA